jgi:hypothetical protein
MGDGADPRMAALEDLSDPLADFDEEQEYSGAEFQGSTMSDAEHVDGDARRDRSLYSPMALPQRSMYPERGSMGSTALPSDFLSDPRRERTPIGPNGIMEDQVAMPGGGQMAIDDLEDQGLMTDALWAKTRPDVQRAHANDGMRQQAGAAISEAELERMRRGGR